MGGPRSVLEWQVFKSRIVSEDPLLSKEPETLDVLNLEFSDRGFQPGDPYPAMVLVELHEPKTHRIQVEDLVFLMLHHFSFLARPGDWTWVRPDYITSHLWVPNWIRTSDRFDRRPAIASRPSLLPHPARAPRRGAGGRPGATGIAGGEPRGLAFGVRQGAQAAAERAIDVRGAPGRVWWVEAWSELLGGGICGHSVFGGSWQ